MHRFRQWWKPLSWRQKTCWLILGIFCAVTFLYFYCGCPAFTGEQKFRRAEKADLIGPSAILGVEDVQMRDYTQKVIIAEDENTITLCGYRDAFLDDTVHLLHREKTGDLTIAVWPGPVDSMAVDEFTMPIFLFDDYPEAMKAKLEFTLTWNSGFEIQYQIESQRDNAGYFRFDVLCKGTYTMDEASGSSLEAVMLYGLATAYDYNQGTSYAVIPVTVRLYNKQDTLLYERELMIQSAMVDAHLKNGDPIE